MSRRPDGLSYDWRSRLFIALSVMGVAVAFYHAYGELTYTTSHLSSCSFSDVFNCGTVFGSGYTTFPPADSIPGFPGISFWVYGVVWFPLCLLVGLRAVRKYGTPTGSMLLPFLMVGNIFTIYPWDIEIVILKGTYCVVCVSMYAINYVLTFVALTSKSDEPSEEGDGPPAQTEGSPDGKNHTSGTAHRLS
jgi:uncharacterized membrane protein